MNNQVLKKLYHTITLNDRHSSGANGGNLRVVRSAGVITVYYQDAHQEVDSATSPILLNRATKRNIKKIEIAK